MQIDRFTFGMRGHDLADNFEDMCKAANKADIRNLQFAMAKTMSDIDFNSIGYSEKVAKRVADAFTENKIKISVLGCYIDPITEETLEGQLAKFESFIRYAGALDATVIGTETGSLEALEDTHSEYAFGRLIKSLERLVPVAEKYGVNIGIEPVWLHTVYSVDVMKRVLDYFKSDNLKVILDPINLLNDDNYINHRQIVENAIEAFGDKIMSLHLKDYIYDGGMKRVPVTLGEFDVAHCLRAIGQLDNIPDIMLDEMPVAELPLVTEGLKEIIQEA